MTEQRSDQTEQRSDQGESARRQSSLESLPTFPGDAENAPPPPLPNRARTCAKYGALAGAVWGTVAGTSVALLGLSDGMFGLTEAVGFFLGVLISNAVVGGIAGGILGAIRDLMTQSRDLAKQREAERREDENREWHAVKQILKQRKDDLRRGTGEAPGADARAPRSPETTKQDEKELCYLCGKRLQPHELASRVCQSCRD